MKILYICHRIPYPPNKGEKIRAFNEIKLLSKEHEIHLAFLVDDSRDIQHIDALKVYCAGCTYDTLNPALKKLSSLVNLTNGKPLSLSFFYSAKLQRDIDRLLDENDFDTIICYSSPMAEYVFRSRSLDKCTAKPKLIMDFVDVDSDKWRMYSRFTPFPLSWIYRREARCLQHYERYVGEKFDVSVLVSPEEKELFASFCPDANAISIANGVDLGFFGDRGAGFSRVSGNDSPVLMFMGAMDYFPNEDAVVYFSNEIFPMVKKQFPRARFLVVGSKPTKKVRRLAEQDPSITVTGYVPDVREYLQQSDIFVAPLRIARGIQNKVLEALAAGLPVVARPEAANVIAGAESCLWIGKDSGEFADIIIRIARGSENPDAKLRNVKEHLRCNYCWENTMPSLEEIIG